MAPASSPSAPRTALPGGTSIVRVGTRLAIVLGVFAAVLAVQRWLGAPRRGSLPSDVIQVYGRLPLSARQRLLLVRVGERMLILLESSRGIGRLAEITNPEEVRRLVERLPAGSTAANPGLTGELLRQIGVDDAYGRG